MINLIESGIFVKNMAASMKAFSFIVSFLFLCLVYASCTKAGLGGDNTIVAFPQHHGRPILSRQSYRDTVFVKFNATELPGTKPSNFDKYFIGEAGEDHVHIHGLQVGNYYLYSVGFDTTIMRRVTGGIAVTLKNKTAETNVNVPVTE